MARSPSIKSVFGHSTHDSGRIIVGSKTLGDLIKEADIIQRNADLSRSTLQKFSAALCKEIERDPKTDIIMGPTKTIQRIIQKAVARYHGDVRQVSDAVRDMITLESPQEVAWAKGVLGSKEFRAAQEAKGVKILAVEDRFEKGTKSGWRGLVVKVEIEKGNSRGEVQMIPKDMLKAYETSHHYQEQSRQLEDLASAQGRGLLSHEKAHIEKFRVDARTVHNNAFAASPFRVLDKSGFDESAHRRFNVA